MKNLTLILSTLLVAAASHADGFVCEAITTDLTAKVYNKTSPSDGTRVPSALILSNPSVSEGRKTIATFRNVTADYSGQGVSFSADVNPEIAEHSRGGELLAGTKLGFVKSLELNVDFDYSHPVVEDETRRGVLTLYKLNGEQIKVEMDCARYLKGE